MIAKLVAEEGEVKGLVLSLDKGEEWIIGRDSNECQLVIADALVSRKHVLAKLTPKGIVVENLSLTNPVQVNEENIDSQPHLLHHGDTLKLGSNTFRYYEDPSAHIVDVENAHLTEEMSEALITPDNVSAAAQNKNKLSPKKTASAASDTIFFDEHDPSNALLAEINFGILESGRWLLKVIGGPNNGAEFYMQASHSYVLGTDPQTCDIVFHDTSVSRQHAKITITPDDVISLEDLKSRNGILINNIPVKQTQTLTPGSIVSMGTTSFAVYDREGEMQTIISPIIPSIQPTPTSHKEDIAKVITPVDNLVTSAESVPIAAIPEPAPKKNYGRLIVFTTLIAFILFGGAGIISLFQTEYIMVKVEENAIPIIQNTIQPFPAVHFSFNKATGSILLFGHVSKIADKAQLEYALKALPFIKTIDDSGIVIDEGVWKEINSILNKDPAWRSINIYSPEPGQFVLSGYLQTRKQAEQLSSYLSVNFPYLDLLKKQVVVEEDMLNQINLWLQEAHIANVTTNIASGEVTLAGKIAEGQEQEFNDIVTKIKNIPGVRLVQNFVRAQTAEKISNDLSSQYQITGRSRVDNKRAVVINGHILVEGDELDDIYAITKITPNQILLEKDGVKYHINY